MNIHTMLPHAFKVSLNALFTALILVTPIHSSAAQPVPSEEKMEQLKSEAAKLVRDNRKLTQVMVDKVFSFSELGFQEYETSKYLTGILEENGFEITRGISGIPTAWIATWGSGKPLIALGSDIDGLPTTSQKPGVAYRDQLIEGAPGHGEGHNSGKPLNITAALAVKEIMERENIQGTLMLWPGVAEELVATKAYYTRDGYFDDVDISLFTHVSSNMSVSWGQAPGTGLISVEYTFEGESAHSAVSPWRGRSALDAVQLMNTGWNYRREHLHPLTRSHAVITSGGDQPNVVPSKASVWYYFRDITYEGIMDLYEIANKMAEGAALMTDTKVSSRILGSAWPRHFNKVIAETMYENIQQVGLPEWTEEDHALAKALQTEINSNNRNGMALTLSDIGKPLPYPVSGGSDDIGDISWKVPTATLRFPANIPGTTMHHWSSAVAMATPIAHKGTNAGAEVIAKTILDFLLKPALIEEAWDYFDNVQSVETTYKPMISADDKPAIHLNAQIMEEFRPQLEKFYYDESEFDTYLEQLGITYPTVRD